MNSLQISNVGLLTVAITALSTAIEMAKSSNYIGAGICAVVGIAVLVIYDKLPTTPPTIPVSEPTAPTPTVPANDITPPSA